VKTVVHKEKFSTSTRVSSSSSSSSSSLSSSDENPRRIMPKKSMVSTLKKDQPVAPVITPTTLQGQGQGSTGNTVSAPVIAPKVIVYKNNVTK
jgi:hypothetical protein